MREREQSKFVLSNPGQSVLFPDTMLFQSNNNFYLALGLFICLFSRIFIYWNKVDIFGSLQNTYRTVSSHNIWKYSIEKKFDQATGKYSPRIILLQFKCFQL